MNKNEQIQIKDYNYDLPDERIAKFPIQHRDNSKLLIYNKGEIKDDKFFNISKYLPEGQLMIFNNTKVIQARLHFRKSTGALIEVFLLEPHHPSDYEHMFQTKDSCQWVCLIGNLKKWKDGQLSQQISIRDNHLTLSVTRVGESGTGHIVQFNWDNDDVSFAEILDAVGELPIPPYLNRKTEESDKHNYQTVYSKIKGSVAAPTAGLHFTDEVLKDIDNSGIIRDEITLHVGAGTFKPVKSEYVRDHSMHTEFISVHIKTLENILRSNCSVTAVGTTSVRTLESLYYLGIKIGDNPDISDAELHIDQWYPYNVEKNIAPSQAISNIIDYMKRNDLSILNASTQIIIVPGYHYNIVKTLITNFHQPQSTLLLLVSAFVNGDWKNIYNYALSNDFRFLSYGDSSILIP